MALLGLSLPCCYCSSCPRRPAAVRLAPTIFVGVIVGLIELLPGAVIRYHRRGSYCPAASGCCCSARIRWPRQVSTAGASLKWAVSGFGTYRVISLSSARSTFAAGHDKTQLGRRLALILVKYLAVGLTLGYAITFADLALLAPFTPSNTARSGGPFHPIIGHLPPPGAVQSQTISSARKSVLSGCA